MELSEYCGALHLCLLFHKFSYKYCGAIHLVISLYLFDEPYL
jgi:hypothetical protein